MRDGRRRSPAVPDPISCTELVALRRKLGRPAMYQPHAKGAVVADNNRSSSSAPLGKIVDTTDFRDEQGQLLYQEVRFEPKEFRLRRPAQEDDAVERVKRGWVWSMKGVPLVLYRLPEILAAIRDGLDVWIAEGPKDAKALVDAGAQATTNAMGADQWEDSYTFKLALAVVEHSSASQFIIVIDRDAAGDDRARDMAESFGRRGWALPLRACRRGQGCVRPSRHPRSRPGGLRSLRGRAPSEATGHQPDITGHRRVRR